MEKSPEVTNYIKNSLTNYLMIQKKIISDITITIMKNNYDANYTNKLFIGDLKKSENTFTHEHYSFEMIPRTSHELHCSFLLAFSYALNILAKPLK